MTHLCRASEREECFRAKGQAASRDDSAGFASTLLTKTQVEEVEAAVVAVVVVAAAEAEEKRR